MYEKELNDSIFLLNYMNWVVTYVNYGCDVAHGSGRSEARAVLRQMSANLRSM